MRKPMWWQRINFEENQLKIELAEERSRVTDKYDPLIPKKVNDRVFTNKIKKAILEESKEHLLDVS